MLSVPRPDSRTGHLVSGSAWAMAGFLAHALTGIIFWLVAARLFASTDVGRAAAIFTSLQFINYATAMGLQEMLARFHHEDAADRDGLFTWSILVTTLTSAVGTIAYLAGVSSVRHVLEDVGLPTGGAIFFLISAGSAVALLVDVRFMAQRRWKWVFWRLVLVGAVRIPFLWVPLPGGDALGLFVVMAGPIALSGLVGVVALRRSGLRLRAWPRPRLVGPATRYAAVNYLAQLALLGPQFVLPVIVLVNVDRTAYANFFLAWSIAAVASILPVTIGRVLVVEGSRPLADLVLHVRRAISLAVGMMAAATLAAILISPHLTAVYGDSYRDAGRLLPRLVGAGIPWAVTAIALGHSRVRHDPLGTVVITGTMAVTTLGLAVLWVPGGGTAAPANAWLVGNLIACAVSGLTWRRAHRLPVGVMPPPTQITPAATPDIRSAPGAEVSWS